MDKFLYFVLLSIVVLFNLLVVIVDVIKKGRHEGVVDYLVAVLPSPSTAVLAIELSLVPVLCRLYAYIKSRKPHNFVKPLRDANTGQTMFTTRTIQLVCDQCKNSPRAKHCTHNVECVPPWHNQETRQPESSLLQLRRHENSDTE
jgi:hypothetical protein